MGNPGATRQRSRLGGSRAQSTVGHSVHYNVSSVSGRSEQTGWLGGGGWFSRSATVSDKQQACEVRGRVPNFFCGAGGACGATSHGASGRRGGTGGGADAYPPPRKKHRAKHGVAVSCGGRSGNVQRAEGDGKKLTATDDDDDADVAARGLPEVGGIDRDDLYIKGLR